MDWIFGLMIAHLGEKVLEVGPGIGLLTDRIVAGREVAALEIDADAAEVLQLRFGALPNFRMLSGDLQNEDWLDRDARGGFDTVVCVNVLEHVPDDVAAIENMRKALRSGGTLFLFVPALMAIYGTLDRAVGHQRRYSLQEVEEKVRQAGFDIVDNTYANLLGAPAWYWSSRITRRSMPNATILRIFDRAVPIWAWVESKMPVPFGMTVVCVARNP